MLSSEVNYAGVPASRKVTNVTTQMDMRFEANAFGMRSVELSNRSTCVYPKLPIFSNGDHQLQCKRFRSFLYARWAESRCGRQNLGFK